MLGSLRNRMTSHSGTVVKSKALILLMILTALAPMVSMTTHQETSQMADADTQFPELGERIVSEAGARAPCPSTQNDGGTSGDAAGGTSTTSRLDPILRRPVHCPDVWIRPIDWISMR